MISFFSNRSIPTCASVVVYRSNTLENLWNEFLSQLKCNTITGSFSHHKPRQPINLTLFNVWTLRSTERLIIEVCVSETRIQDNNTVMRQDSPSVYLTHTLRKTVWGPNCYCIGSSGKSSQLCWRSSADWMELCEKQAMCHQTGRSNLKDRKQLCFFVLSAYAPTDCSDESLYMDEFFHNLQICISKAPRSSIVMIAEDLITWAGRFSDIEFFLGSHHGLHSFHNENGDRPLQFCPVKHLNMSSTSFRHEAAPLATWCSPSSEQRWKPIDHVVIGYRLRGSVQHCRY